MLLVVVMLLLLFLQMLILMAAIMLKPLLAAKLERMLLCVVPQQLHMFAIMGVLMKMLLPVGCQRVSRLAHTLGKPVIVRSHRVRQRHQTRQLVLAAGAIRQRVHRIGRRSLLVRLKRFQRVQMLAGVGGKVGMQRLLEMLETTVAVGQQAREARTDGAVFVAHGDRM